jgi:TrmH family RNA methyltransferase
MVSKKEIKFIRSLQSGKHRLATGFFLVEGEKSLVELLNSSWKTELALLTAAFLNKYPNLKNIRKTRIIEADRELLHKAGSLITNESGIAVAIIPAAVQFIEKSDRLILAAENLKDPGNLGTLLRIADWYGIREILLSENSVDLYNPKVIHSSMGSFLRVHVHYKNLVKVFQNKHMPVIGTFPEGENIYISRLPDRGYVLMGNESQGISDELLPWIDLRVSIPRFGKAESLNVAVAAAVILDNFMRNRR